MFTPTALELRQPDRGGRTPVCDVLLSIYFVHLRHSLEVKHRPQNLNLLTENYHPRAPASPEELCFLFSKLNAALIHLFEFVGVHVVTNQE